jgi:hypothetical protein
MGVLLRSNCTTAALLCLGCCAVFEGKLEAMYHPGIGRFAQRDTGSDSRGEAQASLIGGASIGTFPPRDPTGTGKYADGMSLYQYVSSAPTRRVDPQGLWGWDVHFEKTKEWAGVRPKKVERDESIGMAKWAARETAWACNKVDPPLWRWPFYTTSSNLSWHFDIPHQATLEWNEKDSRYVHAIEELRLAIEICDGDDISDADVNEALGHVGRALHPTQDWVAHGTWDPTWGWWNWFNWRQHPDMSDEPDWDFSSTDDGIVTDGILRDFRRDGIDRKNIAVPGKERITLTETRAIELLNRFKYRIRGSGRCFCSVFPKEER